MKKKIIIAIAAVVLIAAAIVVCFNHNKTTVENPPVENSTPVVENEPAADPTPEATPSEPEKTEPSPEPDKEPVVTDTPEVTETPEPSVEPEPVVTPEPTPTSTPTPEPEPSVEPEAPTPSTQQQADQSNQRVEQEAEQTRQETSGKFTYPPGSGTTGLTASEIAQGYYYDTSNGVIYDQSGNMVGVYMGAMSEDSAIDTEEEKQAMENENRENADKIYDGSGSGSDTSGFNHGSSEVIPTPPSNTQQSTSNNTAGSDPDYDPKYDYDGDGKLNSAEEAMRDLDAWGAQQGEPDPNFSENAQHAFNPVQST